MNNNKQTVYDDRVNRTIIGLSEGVTREELAKEFELSGWKSLDIYMRRKGFTWDKYNKKYIPVTDKIDKVKEVITSAIPMKAQQVINLFEKQGKDADPRSIASDMGFDGHRQMSEYMERKNLCWDTDISNYVERYDVLANRVATQNSSKKQKLVEKKQSQEQVPDFLSMYLPLLQLLESNKERLTDLLLPVYEGQIPKYAVPGAPKTKSIYMSDLLARLVAEFSESKNLSQREIVEAAIVEYLKRYGFKQEMDRLLGKR